MSISVSDLKNLLSMKVSVVGPSFDKAFYHAINNVIRDINRLTAWSVSAIDEDSPPAEIGVDDDLFQVFEYGVAYYLSIASPRWARLSDDRTYVRYMEEIANAEMLAFRKGMVSVGWNYKPSG